MTQSPRKRVRLAAGLTLLEMSIVIGVTLVIIFQKTEQPKAVHQQESGTDVSKIDSDEQAPQPTVDTATKSETLSDS